MVDLWDMLLPQVIGVHLDEGANHLVVGGREGDVGAPDSRMRILVIPANEEASIARQVLQVLASTAPTE